MDDYEFDDFIKQHFFMAPSSDESIQDLYNDLLMNKLTQRQKVMILGYLAYLYSTMSIIYKSTTNPFDILIPITDQWEDAWMELFTDFNNRSYVYFGNNETIRNLSRIVE